MGEMWLRFGDCELDLGRRELRRGNVRVELQRTPLAVLLYLAEHRDRTVPRQELLDVVWPDAVVGDDSLARALAEIRRGLGDDGDEQRVIRTIRGQGVRFAAEVTEVSPAISPRSWPARRLSYGLPVALAMTAACLAAAAIWLSRGEPPARGFSIQMIPLEGIGAEAGVGRFAAGLTAEIEQSLMTGDQEASLIGTDRVGAARTAEGARASHRLLGSVREVDGLRRVSVALQALDTGTRVWSESYDSPASADGLAEQARIARLVSAALLRFRWAEQLASLARTPEEARLAHELPDKIFRGDFRDAFEMAEHITAMNPESWAGHTYASFLALEAARGGEARAKLLPSAEAHARAALRLSSDGSSAGLLAMARVRLAQWRWSEAEGFARDACERNPLDSAGCQMLARTLLYTGRLSEALEIQRQVVERSPHWADFQSQLAVVLFAIRRPQEARAACARANALSGGRHLHCAWFEWALGEREQAARELIRGYRVHGHLTFADALSTELAAGGPEAVWRRVAFADPLGESRGSIDSAFGRRAVFAAQLGDDAAALELLERSLEAREGILAVVVFSPALDSLRESPRFRAVVERAGLAPYTERADSEPL